jgi:hypothetical protein
MGDKLNSYLLEMQAIGIDVISTTAKWYCADGPVIPESQDGDDIDDDQLSDDTTVADETVDTDDPTDVDPDAVVDPATVDDPAAAATDNTVPQSRFDEVYAKEQVSARKLETLKQLDPEAYYKIYPEQRPAAAPSGPEPFTTPYDDQVVEGGKFNGWKFADVLKTDTTEAINLLHKVDPALATNMQFAMIEGNRSATVQRENATKQVKEAADKDMMDFATTMSKDLYQNDDIEKLKPDQQKELYGLVDGVINWMIEGGKTSLSMSDAYFLKNKNDLLAKAAQGGVSALISGMSDTVPTVSGAQGGEAPAGYESYLSMSRDQIGAKMENMTDAQWIDFSTKAPEALKKKYPEFAWD